jgi:hypothetical protein
MKPGEVVLGIFGRVVILYANNVVKDIAHERTISRNPPIHSFKEDRIKLDCTSIGQHLSMLCLYENITN